MFSWLRPERPAGPHPRARPELPHRQSADPARGRKRPAPLQSAPALLLRAVRWRRSVADRLALLRFGGFSTFAGTRDRLHRRPDFGLRGRHNSVDRNHLIDRADQAVDVHMEVLAARNNDRLRYTKSFMRSGRSLASGIWAPSTKTGITSVFRCNAVSTSRRTQSFSRCIPTRACLPEPSHFGPTTAIMMSVSFRTWLIRRRKSTPGRMLSMSIKTEFLAVVGHQTVEDTTGDRLRRLAAIGNENLGHQTGP